MRRGLVECQPCLLILQPYSLHPKPCARFRLRGLHPKHPKPTLNPKPETLNKRLVVGGGGVVVGRSAFVQASPNEATTEVAEKVPVEEQEDLEGQHGQDLGFRV